MTIPLKNSCKAGAYHPVQRKLSQKKVTQDCSLKSVVLITLGFNINMSFYDE